MLWAAWRLFCFLTTPPFSSGPKWDQAVNSACVCVILHGGARAEQAFLLSVAGHVCTHTPHHTHCPHPPPPPQTCWFFFCVCFLHGFAVTWAGQHLVPDSYLLSVPLCMVACCNMPVPSFTPLLPVLLLSSLVRPCFSQTATMHFVTLGQDLFVLPPSAYP